MTGAYIHGRRTPDGPLVTYHQPGEEPLGLDDPDLDWDTAAAARTLALTLIGSLVSPHLPWHVVDSFVERFLANAPRDGWVITLEQIERWKGEHPDWVEESLLRRDR
jgi:hypothetical protein